MPHVRYPLGKDYQGGGQQGAKQYNYRKPAKTEQSDKSDSDESTESTDGSEIGFISTECALRRPYDNHPSNPIPPPLFVHHRSERQKMTLEEPGWHNLWGYG